MAMYDLAAQCYRWRQLLPFPAPEDERQPGQLRAEAARCAREAERVFTRAFAGTADKDQRAHAGPRHQTLENTHKYTRNNSGAGPDGLNGKL